MYLQPPLQSQIISCSAEKALNYRHSLVIMSMDEMSWQYQLHFTLIWIIKCISVSSLTAGASAQTVASVQNHFNLDANSMFPIVLLPTAATDWCFSRRRWKVLVQLYLQRSARGLSGTETCRLSEVTGAQCDTCG